MTKLFGGLVFLTSLMLMPVSHAQEGEIIWLVDPSDLQGLQMTAACPDGESWESEAFIRSEFAALEIPRSHARRLPEAGRIDFLYDISPDGSAVNVRPFRILISGSSMRVSLQEEISERTIEAVEQWKFDLVVDGSSAINCLSNFGFRRLTGGRSR